MDVVVHTFKKTCKAKTHLTNTKITESKIIIYNLSCTMVSCEAKNNAAQRGR